MFWFPLYILDKFSERREVLMNKLKELFRNKKAMALTFAVVLCLAMGTMCFATDGSSTSSTAVPNLTPITTALTTAFTADTIISIIASVIGYSMPFFLMWFAYRFLKRAYVKAVTAGRL